MMKHALPKTLHFGVLAVTLITCKLCGSLAACKIEHETLGNHGVRSIISAYMPLLEG